jgi:hypothetical protein
MLDAFVVDTRWIAIRQPQPGKASRFKLLGIPDDAGRSERPPLVAQVATFRPTVKMSGMRRRRPRRNPARDPRPLWTGDRGLGVIGGAILGASMTDWAGQGWMGRHVCNSMFSRNRTIMTPCQFSWDGPPGRTQVRNSVLAAPHPRFRDFSPTPARISIYAN